MTRDPAWLTDDLEGLKRSHLSRPRRLVKSLGPGRSLIDGRELVDFSTNDYLGLARDPRLILASSDIPTGAGASPLVTGRSEQYSQLEQDIADISINRPRHHWAAVPPLGVLDNQVKQAVKITLDLKSAA